MAGEVEVAEVVEVVEAVGVVGVAEIAWSIFLVKPDFVVSV